MSAWGDRVRFAALSLVVAAASFLAAWGVARLVVPAAAGGPGDAPVDGFETLVREAGLADRELEGGLATFWVHAECVACFHYLGSMLSEARSQRERGAGVVFVVLGTEADAWPLTRFLRDHGRMVHDPTGALFTRAGVTITPQFLLFGPGGRVKRHGRGASAWGTRAPDPDGPPPRVPGTPVGG